VLVLPLLVEEIADDELDLGSGVVQLVKLVLDLFCSISYGCSGSKSQASMYGILVNWLYNWP
jgi:hypothetical protein